MRIDSTDADVRELIVDGVERVLGIARITMEDSQYLFLRQSLAAGRCVKITIPSGGFRRQTDLCTLELEVDETTYPVRFFYEGKEQLDLVQRVMRPVALYLEARNQTLL